ncbi:MAG: hypothetical protein AAGA54_26440, partial [Myxococcota bacterium]
MKRFALILLVALGACDGKTETKDDAKAEAKADAKAPSKDAKADAKAPAETKDAAAGAGDAAEANPQLMDPSKATEEAPATYKVKFETTKGNVTMA